MTVEDDELGRPYEHLHVILTPTTSQALETAAELGRQSGTDAVNKAIQIYRLLLTIEAAGGWIQIKADARTEVVERLRVF